MPFLRLVLMTITIAASTPLFAQNGISTGRAPARLAIYYGYPSLVNLSRGKTDMAAHVFSAYDVVVLGDGLEFADRQPGRYPEGDPEEHQKTSEIIAEVRKHSPTTRFYGYVPLGEIPWPKGQETALSPRELEERIQLWKQMAVSGIFFDEAGYDFPVVTRERQNLVVRISHQLGLSVFMNAYFVEHLFTLDNKPPYASGSDKNPKRLAPLLDGRDLFLLESFQVKNGTYEKAEALEGRLAQALAYRRRYGTHIFATTTTTEEQPFSVEKLNYAWWTARLYDLDGFGWGEPNFAALNNTLPDRRCGGEMGGLARFQKSFAVDSDGTYVWRKAGPLLVVVDSDTHSVRTVSADSYVGAQSVRPLLNALQPQSVLTCSGATE